ncbi:MAG: helix-turn-helix transcriptional regulator [Rhizobiaceae bacterium]|nr:helix-turn-helix transcriptional regulator [Rhizobiaceae bacterium]
MTRDQILKALSSPVRMKMLTWLKTPEKYFEAQQHPLAMGICANEFEQCGLSQSTVSAHLATLQRAGLITAQRVGQWVFYKRDEQVIAEFLACLREEL